MAYKLTKQDLKKLGLRFAEILLCRASARPDEMTELTSRKDWKEAAAHERKKVSSAIANEARATLLRSGYPREQVEKATRHLTRY
ncbi:hypothetical protein [Bilophila wadsworthia]|uniref:hypothetical protein n=1 Tax=Bilophila wadsworthia TaxID=35833 RepID=UPI001DF8090F|nr:hypothetical protein [Bilophila wadsworthia]MBS5375497.1 hypothetical protein [Bilophila wadsworthia]